MPRYEMIFNTEDDEFETCESCGCEVPLDRFPPMRPSQADRLLCEVCATTRIGNLTGVGDVDAPLARVIAQVANLLIEKLSPKQ